MKSVCRFRSLLSIKPCCQFMHTRNVCAQKINKESPLSFIDFLLLTYGFRVLYSAPKQFLLEMKPSWKLL